MTEKLEPQAEARGETWLPDDVFQTLERVCARYGGRAITDPYQFGVVLNEVAWTHRDQGWGLSRKTGGKRVPSPVGEVAEDILHNRYSNLHWDVFQGADTGQPLRPNQGPAIGPMRDPNRPWVEPVRPEGHHEPGPDPEPEPGPEPEPEEPPMDQATREALRRIADAVTQLQGDVAVIRERQAEQVAHLNMHHWIGHEVLPHIDDCKRMVAGLPRDPRFTGEGE